MRPCAREYLEEKPTVALVRRDTGETLIEFKMPPEVRRLMVALMSHTALYGVALDMETLRFGIQ